MIITTTMIKELRAATGAGPLACRQALHTYHGNFEQAANYLRRQDLSRAAQKTGRATGEGLVILKQTRNNTGVDSIGAVELTCETDFVARTAEFKTLGHRLAAQVLANATLTDTDKLLAAGFIDAPQKTTAQVVQELVGQLGENIVVKQAVRYAASPATLIEGYLHVGDVDGYGPQEGRIGVVVELGANQTMANNPQLRHLAHDLALQIAACQPVYLSSADIPGEVVQKERQTFIDEVATASKTEEIKAKIVKNRLGEYYREVCLLEQPFVKDNQLTIAELVRQKSRETGITIHIKRFARFEVGV